MSLLRSLVADAESSVLPYHTIVEVYRVAPHMPLMRVLPSAADEVNAALFHPFKASPQSFFFIPLSVLSIFLMQLCLIAQGSSPHGGHPGSFGIAANGDLECVRSSILPCREAGAPGQLLGSWQRLVLTMLHCAGRWHCIWHQRGAAAGVEALSQRCTWVAEPHHGQPGQLSQPCRRAHRGRPAGSSTGCLL